MKAKTKKDIVREVSRALFAGGYSVGLAAVRNGWSGKDGARQFLVCAWAVGDVEAVARFSRGMHIACGTRALAGTAEDQDQHVWSWFCELSRREAVRIMAAIERKGGVV